MVESPPRGWIPESRLNPNTHGSDSSNTSTKFIAIDFFLDISNFSEQHAIIFSNTAMTVDKAAKVINRKNIAPHILPPVIDVKTLGRVINIKMCIRDRI